MKKRYTIERLYMGFLNIFKKITKILNKPRRNTQYYSFKEYYNYTVRNFPILTLQLIESTNYYLFYIFGIFFFFCRLVNI